jgi:hypothetical protein
MEFGLGMLAGLVLAGLLALLWAVCAVGARCTRAEEVRRELVYVGEDADGNPIFFPREVGHDGPQDSDGER